MTQKKSVFIKSVLFVLGLGIIALVCYLFTGFKNFTNEQKYIWFSIAGMYVVFFCPFFFSEIHVKTADGKNPPLTMVWLGGIVLIAISAGMTISVAYQVVQITIAIGTECALVFLFAIDSYFGYFANSHAQDVEQHESQALSLIKQIRSSLEILSLKAGGLNKSYDEEKKRVACLAENVKHISQVEDAAAVKLEQDILGAITSASSACDSTLAGGDGMEFKKQLASLDNLIKQRKMLKNE